MQFEVEIVNWNKFNPRNDMKVMSWFRMSSELGHDQKLFGLRPDEKWVWIFLLCEAAKKTGSKFKTDLQYLAYYTRVDEKLITHTLDYLEEQNLIKIDRSKPIPYADRNRSDQIESGSNVTGRNGTERNVTISIPPSAPEASPKKKPLLKFEAEDSALADKWIIHALSISATSKFDVDKFADAIRKARELMKFSHPEMKALLNFIVKDDFWHDKAYSPVGLTKRSKSNEQPKIANIAASAFKKNREWKNIISWAKDQDSKSTTGTNDDDLQDFNFLKNF